MQLDGQADDITVEAFDLFKILFAVFCKLDLLRAVGLKPPGQVHPTGERRFNLGYQGLHADQEKYRQMSN
jgi:hypothetical protein